MYVLIPEEAGLPEWPVLTSPPVHLVPARLPNAGTAEVYGYNAINQMNAQDKLNNADSFALLGAGKYFF